MIKYFPDSLEVHTDAFSKGQKVLLIDDLLATGGTMSACEKLVEKCGAEVAGCAFLIELALDGGEVTEPSSGFRLGGKWPIQEGQQEIQAEIEMLYLLDQFIDAEDENICQQKSRCVFPRCDSR